MAVAREQVLQLRPRAASTRTLGHALVVGAGDHGVLPGAGAHARRQLRLAPVSVDESRPQSVGQLDERTPYDTRHDQLRLLDQHCR